MTFKGLAVKLTTSQQQQWKSEVSGIASSIYWKQIPVNIECQLIEDRLLIEKSCQSSIPRKNLWEWKKTGMVNTITLSKLHVYFWIFLIQYITSSKKYILKDTFHLVSIKLLLTVKFSPPKSFCSNESSHK